MDEQGARKIAARVPAYLRSLRGQVALSRVCREMGIVEVDCPACGGSGWLNKTALHHCPLCCGFRQVPDGLCAWFEGQVRRRENGSARRRPTASETCLCKGRETRYGLTAERLHKVALEGGLQAIL